MAVTRRAHGTVSKVTSGDLSPGAPAGSVAGDLWLCFVSAAGTAAVSMDPAWTPAYNATIGSTLRYACFAHTYAGAAPPLTVTNAGTDNAIAFIVAYATDLADTAVSISALSSLGLTNNNTTLSFNGIAVAVANSMVVWAWHTISGAAGTNGTLSASDPVPTEQLDDTTGSGNVVGTGYADGIRPSATNTGSRTSTYTTTVPNHGSGTLCLREISSFGQVLRKSAAKPAYVPGQRFDPKWQEFRNHVVGFWPFWERWASWVNNWNTRLEPPIVSDMMSWTDTDIGPAMHFDPTSQVFDTGETRLGEERVGLFAGPDETWTVLSLQRSAALNGSTMIGRCGASAPTRTFALAWSTSTAGLPSIVTLIRGTVTTTDFDITDNLWHTLAVTWSGSAGVLYCDGVPKNLSVGVVAAEETSETITFGNRTASAPAAGGWSGDLALVAILDTALDQGAINEWNADPFAPWRPPPRPALKPVSYQFLRPVDDISTGTWARVPGAADLYTAVDEVDSDDTDRVESATNPNDDTVEFELGPGTTPDAGTVNLEIRHRLN